MILITNAQMTKVINLLIEIEKNAKTAEVKLLIRKIGGVLEQAEHVTLKLDS